MGAKNPLPSRAQVTIIDVVTDVATTSLDGSHCRRAGAKERIENKVIEVRIELDEPPWQCHRERSRV